MAAIQSQFSPKQVAAALGVSESSVKRWCDRGVIGTVKTAGGHRRIPLDALLQFLASSHHPLAEPKAVGLSSRPAAVAVRRSALPGTPSQQTFRSLLARGDEQGCRVELRRRQQQIGSAALAAEELIADAMHCFGAAWEANELAVYQERRACEICARLIWELREVVPMPTAEAPVAIGGAPAGDPYQLPTALVELALREAGWAATSLGNDLPLDTMLQATVDYRPRLVWMSVSAVADEARFVEPFNAFAAALPSDVVLLVGGRALSDVLRPQLRYTAHCDNLRQLIDLAAVMRQRQEA